MKKVVQLLVLTFLSASCKEKNPSPGFDAGLVGNWRSTAYWDKMQGSWMAMMSDTIRFRTDGVLVDRNGKRSCCLPLKYNINGKTITVSPKEPVEFSAHCAAVNCAAVDVIFMDFENDELTMWYGGVPVKMKYVRF